MPRRILLVDPGAHGAFYGSRLAVVPSVCVYALCRSNLLKAVQQFGFRVESPKYQKYVFRPKKISQSWRDTLDITNGLKYKWNYVVITAKALFDASDDSRLLDRLVTKTTAIVVLQNGLGVEAPFARRYPRALILGAVPFANCAQPEHGFIRHGGGTRISVGPYLTNGRALSRDKIKWADDEAGKLCKLLGRSGIRDSERLGHEGMQFVRWHNVAVNAAMNPTALAARTGGCEKPQLSSDEAALAEHQIGVMEEVLAAACKVLGTKLPDGLPKPHEVLKLCRESAPEKPPGMWLDWEGDEPMEDFEAMLGNPIQMAKEVGFEMPRLQAIYASLRAEQARREQSASQREDLSRMEQDE